MWCCTRSGRRWDKASPEGSEGCAHVDSRRVRLMWVAVMEGSNRLIASKVLSVTNQPLEVEFGQQEGLVRHKQDRQPHHIAAEPSHVQLFVTTFTYQKHVQPNQICYTLLDTLFVSLLLSHYRPPSHAIPATVIASEASFFGCSPPLSPALLSRLCLGKAALCWPE